MISILFLSQASKLLAPSQEPLPPEKLLQPGGDYLGNRAAPSRRLSKGTWLSRARGFWKKQVLVKEAGRQPPGAPNLSSVLAGAPLPVQPQNGTASQPPGYGICQ